jgi:hypothetical protein
MNVEKMLFECRAELDRLKQKISQLEDQRDHPKPKKPIGRREIGPTECEAISQRMRRWWALKKGRGSVQ